MKQGNNIIAGRIAILGLGIALLLIGLPRSTRQVSGHPPSGFDCKLNIPQLINPIGDDTALEAHTQLTCSHDLTGETVRLASLSDPSIYIDHSEGRINGSTYNLGYNLGLSAHTGENIIQVELTGQFSANFEFRFTVDDQPPELLVGTSSSNAFVNVVDSDSPITSVSAVAKVGDSFKELELLRGGVTVPGTPSTPRQHSFILQPPFDGNVLVTATDQAGNSSEQYLGSLPIQKFKKSLFEYHQAERAALVRSARGAQDEQPTGSYGLKLALLFMVPRQLSDADLVERLAELHSTVGEAVQTLEDEFLLNQRPIPSLKVNSMADLSMYVRKVGETHAREVKLDSLLNPNGGTLVYGRTVDNLAALPANSYSEYQDSAGNWGVRLYSGVDNDLLKAQESLILGAAFPPSRTTGAERLLVVVDGNMRRVLGWYPLATRTALIMRQHGGELWNRKSEEERANVAEVILHELGHSVGLGHTVETNEVDGISPHKGLYYDGRTVMYRSGVGNGRRFTYAQVAAFQYRLFGLPESIVQGVVPNTIWPDGQVSTGHEQFQFEDLVQYQQMGIGLPDRVVFPAIAADGGTLPPVYPARSYYAHPSYDLYFNQRLEFPAIAYNPQPPTDTIVLMPSYINRTTARLEKERDIARSRDTFVVRPGTRVVHLGFIPLSEGLFEPFYEGDGQESPLARLIPRSDQAWNQLSGRGVNAVELPVGQDVQISIGCDATFDDLVCRVTEKTHESQTGVTIYNMSVYVSKASRRNGAVHLVPFALVYRPSELTPIQGGPVRFNSEDFQR